MFIISSLIQNVTSFIIFMSNIVGITSICAGLDAIHVGHLLLLIEENGGEYKGLMMNKIPPQKILWP